MMFNNLDFTWRELATGVAICIIFIIGCATIIFWGVDLLFLLFGD